jgi:hypothetical protein
MFTKIDLEYLKLVVQIEAVIGTYLH